MRRASASHAKLDALFDSSVPEPTALLRETILEAFGPSVPPSYASAFVAGNPFVVRQLQRDYDAPPESILCTTGATGAIALLYRTFLRAGDRVLVENPGFDLFADLAEASGIAVDRFERRPHDWSLDPSAVASALHPRTRLVVLANLHNPSGTLADDATLREVAAMADRNGARLIVDEVYAGYAMAVPHRPAMRLAPNVVSVSSLTKIYGLSTLRCGWLAGHPDLVAQVRELHDRFEFGVSKLGHAIAALVLENRAPWERHWQDCLGAARPVIEACARDWHAEGLAEGEVPAHGCIWFPHLPEVLDTRHFAAWLIDRFGVLVAPGEFFGAPGHVRIGFGQDAASLGSGLDRFAAGLREYRRRRVG
jgi:aspartate/methionine/tyrosine aminotransferase